MTKHINIDTPTPPEPNRITCRNCNKQNVPNWKDGLCITCARDEVLGKPEPSTDPQDNQDQPNDENIRFFNLGVEQGKAMAQDKQRDDLIELLVEAFGIDKLGGKKKQEAINKYETAITKLDLYSQSRVREAREQELEEVSIQSLGIRTATDADELRDYIDKRIAQLNQPRKDNQ